MPTNTDNELKSTPQEFTTIAKNWCKEDNTTRIDPAKLFETLDTIYFHSPCEFKDACFELNGIPAEFINLYKQSSRERAKKLNPERFFEEYISFAFVAKCKFLQTNYEDNTTKEEVANFKTTIITIYKFIYNICKEDYTHEQRNKLFKFIVLILFKIIDVTSLNDVRYFCVQAAYVLLKKIDNINFADENGSTLISLLLYAYKKDPETNLRTKPNIMGTDDIKVLMDIFSEKYNKPPSAKIALQLAVINENTNDDKYEALFTILIKREGIGFHELNEILKQAIYHNHRVLIEIIGLYYLQNNGDKLAVSDLIVGRYISTNLLDGFACYMRIMDLSSAALLARSYEIHKTTESFYLTIINILALQPLLSRQLQNSVLLFLANNEHTCAGLFAHATKFSCVLSKVPLEKLQLSNAMDAAHKAKNTTFLLIVLKFILPQLELIENIDARMHGMFRYKEGSYPRLEELTLQNKEQRNGNGNGNGNRNISKLKTIENSLPYSQRIRNKLAAQILDLVEQHLDVTIILEHLQAVINSTWLYSPKFENDLLTAINAKLELICNQNKALFPSVRSVIREAASFLPSVDNTFIERNIAKIAGPGFGA